jgi:glycyl-tRNA synthetase
MPTIEEIEQLAKRRGFFFPSSEIYGGLSGFFDYGHVGTLMKRKIESLWRSFFKGLNDNYYEIETSLMMPEKVFEASGHLHSFVDPIAKCSKCGTVHRADHIVEEYLKESFEGMTPEELLELIKNHKIRCPKCKGELKEVGVLNMMFPINIGAQGEFKTYLRPETAQGAYVNFSRMFELLRKQMPVGIFLIGKAFRNEISPRQLTTRMREFSQAELQIFFDPKKIDEHEKWNEVKNYKLILLPFSERNKKPMEITCEEAVKKLGLHKFYVYHMAKVQELFLEKFQIPKNKFRLKELSEEERAFYNKVHWDIEFDLESIGWKEIGGVHYRTDHDLKGHEKVSKQSQEIFFDEKKFIPHVLELSFGIDRIIFSLLDIFFKKEKDRTLLKLPNSISPFIATIFPLVSKDNLDKKAREVYEKIKSLGIFYDDSGSIGRRYARADEIGVPFSITIDYDTMEDDTVTVRNRDTTKQDRIKISELPKFLHRNHELGLAI